MTIEAIDERRQARGLLREMRGPMSEPVEPNRIRKLAEDAKVGVSRLTAEIEAATDDKERKELIKRR